MMGTKVLRPHDCLIERFIVPPATIFPCRRSNYYHCYNNRSTKPIRSKPVLMRFDHKTISRRYNSNDLKQLKNNHNHNYQLVKEQPDMSMIPKHIVVNDPKRGNRSRSLSMKPIDGGILDLYAGSAISVSPSPESLPFPSFSKKKISTIVGDSATRDLRRLLRLD